MLQLQRIQKQIDWVIKQIMCIKDGTCSCGMQPTSLNWDDVEQELTASFANGETHTVEMPLNGKADVEALNQIIQDLSNHENDFNNPHQVTQDQVGLGNVDNTSDLDKPISTATQTALDSKLESGDNISELVNDVGYITIGDVPQAPVLSVAGKTGVVVLFKADITDFNEADYATAAQGLLADSALQPGDNISLLNNDVGYITDYTVTQNDVTQYQSSLSITESQISDLNSFSGDYNDLTNQPTIPTNNNELTNGAGYITLSEIPSNPPAPVTSVNGITGDVELDADNIDDTSTDHKFATESQLTQIQSNTNNFDNYLPKLLQQFELVNLNDNPLAIFQNIFESPSSSRYGILFEDGEIKTISGNKEKYFDSESGYRFNTGVSGYIKNLSNSPGIDTLNLTQYNHFKKTISSNTTLTLGDIPNGTNLTFVIEITQGGSGSNTVTFDNSNVTVKYTSLDVDETVGNITEFWCRYDHFSNTIFVNSIKGFTTL